MVELIHSPVFTFVMLPLFIFVSRIMDVSLDTLRIVFVARGNKKIAPVLGFFEVLIWIIAITRIMQNLDNWLCYVAYAGGFASGNYVGLYIEERLAIGLRAVRMFSIRNTSEIIENLNSAGFPVTKMEGEGKKGKVNILFMLVRRDELSKALKIIHNIDPELLYTVEDVRSVNKGGLPAPGMSTELLAQRLFQRQSR
jgi:uncharacterized protein YebE (UPF0316 family)